MTILLGLSDDANIILFESCSSNVNIVSFRDFGINELDINPVWIRWCVACYE